MINSNEQCRKSADNFSNDNLTESFSNISITDIDSILEDISSDIMMHASSILILIEEDINLPLLKYLINAFADKDIKIFLTDINKNTVNADDYKVVFGDEFFNSYYNKFICYNKSTQADYKFFGTTKDKVPIFLHNSFITADFILPICKVKYNSDSLILSAKQLVAFGLMAEKSLLKFNTLLSDNSDQSAILADKVATEICLIARSDVEYFVLNFSMSSEERVDYLNIGDILLSHIEIIKYLENK